MTEKGRVAFMMLVMVAGIVILLTDTAPYAEAQKGRGVSISAGADICGLSLCSEYPGGRAAYEAEWVLMFMPMQDTQSEAIRPGESVSSWNADTEFPARLDDVIHRFELDKIPAEEAIAGIEEVHHQYASANISNDIIRGVGEKLDLYREGTLNAEDAVEAIHLTAEPQNVDPEFIAAVEVHIYQFELGDTSAEEALVGITEVYDRMAGLTITSELIESVGQQLATYEKGIVSIEYTMEEIGELVEETERAIQSEMSEGFIPEMKELPPNTVDMPAGSGVPGCETDGWCYIPDGITAHVGDTITWQNSDTLPHTVTSGDGDADTVGFDVPNGFDSGFMSAGDTFEHTFAVAGVFEYYCQLHPWMEGSVTID